ncbi:MAG: hypothetical protein OXI63_13270 [Candidatus Poribacteria bacterium]|nr:hypothetical protein [Candidatus Poribacteria bacterium]
MIPRLNNLCQPKSGSKRGYSVIIYRLSVDEIGKAGRDESTPRAQQNLAIKEAA